MGIKCRGAVRMLVLFNNHTSCIFTRKGYCLYIINNFSVILLSFVNQCLIYSDFWQRSWLIVVWCVHSGSYVQCDTVQRGRSATGTRTAGSLDISLPDLTVSHPRRLIFNLTLFLLGYYSNSHLNKRTPVWVSLWTLQQQYSLPTVLDHQAAALGRLSCW